MTITRKDVRKDSAEMVNIRSHELGRDLTAAEKHQCERDVEKCADRAERKANGEGVTKIAR